MASSLRSFENVHFAGFTGTLANTTAFWGVGASRRRTGVWMTGITAAATLAGGQPGFPLFAWQDFGAQVPANQNFAALSDLDPRAWAFSIDNPDGSLSGASGLPTVVANHPMMLFGLETPVSNTVGPTRAFASPFRFGYLRVVATELSGTGSPTDPRFGLQYTRERFVPPADLHTYTYENRWLIDPYKQMAVVLDRPTVDNRVRYKLKWYDPTIGPPSGQPDIVPMKTQLWLSELQTGESALIGLQSYVPPSGLPATAMVRRATELAAYLTYSVQSFEPVPRVQSFGALTPGLAQTCYFDDAATGILWIRIVATAAVDPGGAIQLHADGLGQVIQVDL